MKFLFAIAFTIFLVFDGFQCEFGSFFPGPPFGNGWGVHRGGHHGGHRRNEYSLSAIIRKVVQMEGYAERYLDRAINVARARNSSDVEMLQGIRDTDLPQFFQSIIQKLNAAKNSTTSPVAFISSTANSVNLTDV